MTSPLAERPIFFIGMPRSGTTAISEAVSLHDDLGWFSNYVGRLPCLPWLAFFDRLSFVAGGRLRGKKNQTGGLSSALRRFLPHTDEAYGIWKRFCGEKFLYDYLLEVSATDQERENLRVFVAQLLCVQGKKRFFTKVTGPARIHFLKSIFPDAFFVHVVRDPRAVVASLASVGFWQQGGGADEPWWQNGLLSQDIVEWHDEGRTAIALAAVQWRRVVTLAREEAKLLGPGQYMEVRYEDFINSPHAVMQEIFQVLRLKDCASVSRYLDTFGRPINMNVKFASRLTESEIRVVERLTKETARQFGYSWGMSAPS